VAAVGAAAACAAGWSERPTRFQLAALLIATFAMASAAWPDAPGTPSSGQSDGPQIRAGPSPKGVVPLVLFLG
jgi:hypothetical protein